MCHTDVKSHASIDDRALTGTAHTKVVKNTHAVVFPQRTVVTRLQALVSIKPYSG